MNLLNLFEKFLRRIQSEGNELFQGHKITGFLCVVKKCQICEGTSDITIFNPPLKREFNVKFNGNKIII
jgi:hypothetical protein